jgi:hypothetical protein
MRVSEYYNLGRTQPELDFVDVDVVGDVRVFVDPHALRRLESDWGAECRSLIQNCFRTVITSLQSGDEIRARGILGALREPNETHLGLSRGRARGRALGNESAIDVADSLAKSTAVRTGLLEDLEDTILMVENIGPDIISDITTNIIRHPLIKYTQQMCGIYGIPIEEVGSGRLWDPNHAQWYTAMVQQPVAQGRRLLLVPKSIVRLHMDYDPEEYYRLYLLEHLREAELSANTELVRLLKSGERRVYIGDLIKKYGTGKAASVKITREHPELLQNYRDYKRQSVGSPLDHIILSEMTGSGLPSLDALLANILSTPEGSDYATEYHRNVEKLLSALFSTDLSCPEIEQKIHEGRKRIDITYTNVASKGFFKWIGDHAPAPYIFVECKNYSREIANPELDQMSGRFSLRRGKFGIIVCRKLHDKELFIKRCRDTANDDRGIIVPIDDEDLKILVDQMKDATTLPGNYPIIKRICDSIFL